MVLTQIEPLLVVSFDDPSLALALIWGANLVLNMNLVLLSTSIHHPRFCVGLSGRGIVTRSLNLRAHALHLCHTLSTTATKYLAKELRRSQLRPTFHLHELLLCSITISPMLSTSLNYLFFHHINVFHFGAADFLFFFIITFHYLRIILNYIFLYFK